MRDVGAAEAAIRLLKDDDAGRVGLLVGGTVPPTTSTTVPGRRCPPGARSALDVVTVPDALRPAVTRLLAGVVVVDDLATARRAVEAAARPGGRHPRG